MKPLLTFVRVQHVDGHQTLETTVRDPVHIPAGSRLRMVDMRSTGGEGAVAAVVTMVPAINEHPGNDAHDQREPNQ